MKNFLFRVFLLFSLPYFTLASDIDFNKNHYYLIKIDKINVKEQERAWFVGSLNTLISSNEQNINILGCDFKRFEVSKENINNQLNKINFFDDYDEELKKYGLSLNNFNSLYFIDSSNQSERCSNLSYKIIILLNNNELMIPYERYLIFYKQLAITDENKINNLKQNKKCLERKYFEMGSMDVCYYKNMTILDVYTAMSFEPSNVFRKKIKIGENFTDTYDDLSVEVKYKWKGKNKLEIEQNFDGGVTSYTFIYQNNRTKLIANYYPD